MDSTEGEVLVWKRASKENKIVKNLEKVTQMLGHVVTDYTKKTEKNLRKMKKRF